MRLCAAATFILGPAAWWLSSNSMHMRLTPCVLLCVLCGVQVILDVVFNHTAEGNEKGPTLSFRGLDNRVYYMLAPLGEYYNYRCGHATQGPRPSCCASSCATKQQGGCVCTPALHASSHALHPQPGWNHSTDTA